MCAGMQMSESQTRWREAQISGRAVTRVSQKEVRSVSSSVCFQRRSLGSQ